MMAMRGGWEGRWGEGRGGKEERCSKLPAKKAEKLHWKCFSSYLPKRLNERSKQFANEIKPLFWSPPTSYIVPLTSSFFLGDMGVRGWVGAWVGMCVGDKGRSREDSPAFLKALHL